MAGTTYSKFFWQDWIGDDAVALCSMGARGTWMGLLAVAARSTTPGHVLLGGKKPSLPDLRQALRCPPTFTDADLQAHLDELLSRGVYDTTRDGVIVSRRLVRDARRRQISTNGGLARQKQRIEDEGEKSVGTRRVVQPPSTISQSPSASKPASAPDSARKDGQRLAVLSELLGIDYNRSPTGTIAHVTQLIDLERAGVDIEQDLIPCIRALREQGRSVEGKPIKYFREAALDFRRARAVAASAQAEIDAEIDRKIAAMTEDQWRRALSWWLFIGLWSREYGPRPDDPKCRAPARDLSGARNVWTKLLGGRPYARRDLNEGLVPVDWPEHGDWPKRELELTDLSAFMTTGEDFRVVERAPNVIPLRKAN